MSDAAPVLTLVLALTGLALLLAGWRRHARAAADRATARRWAAWTWVRPARRRRTGATPPAPHRLPGDHR